MNKKIEPIYHMPQSKDETEFKFNYIRGLKQIVKDYEQEIKSLEKQAADYMIKIQVTKNKIKELLNEDN